MRKFCIFVSGLLSAPWRLTVTCRLVSCCAGPKLGHPAQVSPRCPSHKSCLSRTTSHRSATAEWHSAGLGSFQRSAASRRMVWQGPQPCVLGVSCRLRQPDEDHRRHQALGPRRKGEQVCETGRCSGGCLNSSWTSSLYRRRLMNRWPASWWVT